MLRLEISICEQKMYVFKDQRFFKSYLISTAKKGVGEIKGSEQTPRGRHIVRAKIGKDSPINSVFINRRPTGEIYHSKMREIDPGRDWILTRILWLSGVELGKNRLGEVDTMRRYIYIHGSPDDVVLGKPGSRGCIRMHNNDIIELFEQIPIRTHVLIQEDALCYK